MSSAHCTAISLAGVRRPRILGVVHYRFRPRALLIRRHQAPSGQQQRGLGEPGQILVQRFKQNFLQLSAMGQGVAVLLDAQ